MYLGTEYYPAILTEEFFAQVQEAWEKRTHPGSVIATEPIPVQTRFSLSLSITSCGKTGGEESAAERCSRLYSLILPDPDGKAEASSSDVAVLKDMIRQSKNTGEVSKAEKEIDERNIRTIW